MGTNYYLLPKGQHIGKIINRGRENTNMFQWAMAPGACPALADINDNVMIVEDEYGVQMTGDEFRRLLLPLFHDQSLIGTEFS